MMIDYTKLSRKLIPPKDGEPATHLRTATVNVVNADGTLNLLMASGVIVPNVPKLDSVYVAVNSVVQVISLRGSMLVIGGISRGSVGVYQFNTSNSTSTSTTYTSLSGGDIHGQSFIAPASGKVATVIQGWLGCSSASGARRAFMSQQLREGSSINSGTIVQSPGDENAAVSQNVLTTGFDYRYVSFNYVYSGLTPGSAYNLVTMVRVNTSGDSVAINDRHMIIRPSG